MYKWNFTFLDSSIRAISSEVCSHTHPLFSDLGLSSEYNSFWSPDFFRKQQLYEMEEEVGLLKAVYGSLFYTTCKANVWIGV